MFNSAFSFGNESKHKMQSSKYEIRFCKTSAFVCAFSVLSPSAYFDYKEDGVLPKPPSYNVATTLPSYDEAERTKAETTVPLVTGRVSISLFFLFACGHIQYVHYMHTHNTATCARTLAALSARQEVLSGPLRKVFLFCRQNSV